MLRILDKNKVPVKGLRKYSDLCIENSIELDDKTLTFSVPYRNVRSAIAVEGYIETKDDRFVVKEIEKSSEGTAIITAQLDLESLEGKPFRAFKSEEQTIKATLQLAFAGTGWTVGECRIKKKRTLSMANVSALDVLKQALKTYRVEIKIDSKKQSIDIYPEVGSDKGVYFSDQLNLRKLTVQYSTYDFYTEIEPYGKDGLTIETVNSGKTYLENHQYSSKKKRCIWKDERYTIADSLKEDAAAKLADMSKPYVSYSADIVDLSRNSQKYSILQYEIGDTVTLIDHVTGEKEKQRIVSMKIYPEAPEKNSCTLANKVLTFDELAQKYEDTADTVDNITNDNGQVDGDAIDGIHSRQIVDLENGIIESAYIKDLSVKYLQVSRKITAVEGEFGTLKANTAQFEETYTKKLEAVEADINTLRTTDLSAVNAKIDVLDGNYANIKTLLSGGAGIGDLQNIHLTSQNAVIDSALIRSAVMQTVSDVAKNAAEGIQTTNQNVASIKTGLDGMDLKLSETTSELYGLKEGTLLYNCTYHDNGDNTTTVTAVVYRAGKDVTKEFPESCYTWKRKTEAGEQALGSGYSITVSNNDYIFGGVVVGQFTTDADENQRKALLSIREGVVEIDGKPVSLSAEQKDYVDANTLSEVVTIPAGKKFIFTDAATNQGGIVALENLARQILLNLTTQTFELDQGAKTLPDALNELNRDLQYIPIEILASSNNIGVAEKGSTLNELTLKWQLNKDPETILMNGQVRVDLKTLRSLTLKDMALTADKTFMLQVTDEKGKTAQKNTSVVFQNGVYYGVSEIPEEVNNTFILSLSRSLQGSRTKTFRTTSTEGQYVWYAFPSRYGTPVFNVGGFDGGFTKAASISFTNASGYTEEYAVYRSDNSNLGTKTIKVT